MKEEIRNPIEKYKNDLPEFQNMGGIKHERRLVMLFTIAAILVILWLLGLITSYTIGGFIHALLVIAVIVVLLRIIQGKKIA